MSKRYLAIINTNTNVVITQLLIPESVTDDQIIAMDNKLQETPYAEIRDIEICVVEDN